MKLEIAALTDTGRVRENNEDSLGTFDLTDANAGWLFVVADGMGGHHGGEIASRLAVETIHKAFASTNGSVPESLERAFYQANEAIHQAAVADAELSGMGTTCTAMVVVEGEAFFAHIGDSRAYLLRDGEFRQITEDHSLVGEMVRSGIITKEDAKIHPKRNVITRSLGVQADVVADVSGTPLALRAGDRILLCSDGLTGLVDDEDIAPVLEAMEPQAAARQLIDMANAAGGRDNITLQIVRYVG